MQNDKTKRIQQLRADSLDENRSPADRIKSAHRLLTEFGPSDRNRPIVNSVIKEFEKTADYDIQQRCLKLKLKFVRAKTLKEVAAVEITDESIQTEEAAPSPDDKSRDLDDSPKASLSKESVEQIIRQIAGALKFDSLPDLTAIPVEKQNLIVERIVRDSGMSLSPDEVRSVALNIETVGLGSVFPGLTELFRRYAEETKFLLDALNRRVFPGVQ